MQQLIEREDVNMSKLSRDSGYTLSHVSRVFSRNRVMSLTCAKRLSTILGITIDEMVRLVEDGKVTINRQEEAIER